MDPTLEEIKSMALHAGEILRDGYNQTNKYIQMKGATDLVTVYDKKSEDYLVSTIKQKFPDHGIIAEESGKHNSSSDSCWHIDPLDGTLNFAHGIPFFSVSIAYAEKGEILLGAVYDPTRDELFYAEKGKGAWLNNDKLMVAGQKELIGSLCVTGLPYDHYSPEMKRGLELFNRFSIHSQGCRRLGSAALDLCYVAAGRIDFFYEVEVCTYDIAAGVLMTREAGGLVTRFDGSQDVLSPPITIVAANRELHPRVLEVILKD
jgi:myo-inositol-1(or 4)-monophosphatase